VKVTPAKSVIRKEAKKGPNPAFGFFSRGIPDHGASRNTDPPPCAAPSRPAPTITRLLGVHRGLNRPAHGPGTCTPHGLPWPMGRRLQGPGLPPRPYPGRRSRSALKSGKNAEARRQGRIPRPVAEKAEGRRRREGRLRTARAYRLPRSHHGPVRRRARRRPASSVFCGGLSPPARTKQRRAASPSAHEGREVPPPRRAHLPGAVCARSAGHGLPSLAVASA
jgi:hypothetical protein